MTKQQIPTPADIVRPAVDALVEARPRSVRHLATGRYGDIVAGWFGQTRIMRGRLASEVAARRLSCSGQELRELVKSEYWCEFDESIRTAVGEVFLTRTVTNNSNATTGNFAPGVIARGTRFRKRADPSKSPPIEESTYQTVEPVVVDADDTPGSPPEDLGGGQWNHTQIVLVPVEATAGGAHANIPFFIGEGLTTADVVDPLFDTSFTATVEAAGGGSTYDDETLRQLAKAQYLGQFGPNTSALIAGALSVGGVAHVAHTEDRTTGTARLYVADAQWGQSGRLADVVEQKIKDDVLGFGCMVSVGHILNIRITVEVAIVLTDPKYATNTTEIAEGIRSQLRPYFDDRDDFYTWRLNAVGAIAAQADHRILTCTGAVVKDRNGNVLAEPSKIDPTGNTIAHYYLADNAVKVTFSTPS